MIESPCINVCTVVDGECVGCFRTEKQIEEWLHYTDKEREKINSIKNLSIISLGPRILRSDTAIVSSLSVLHSIMGDWV